MTTPDPATPLDEPTPERPVHQRLQGVALRTAVVILASLPLLIATFGTEWREYPIGLTVIGVGALCLFAVERRGAPPGEVALRVYLGSVLTMLVGPLAVIAVANLGNPLGALGELDRELQRLSPPFGLGLFAFALAVFTYIYFYVRSQSDKPVPQVLSIFLLGAIPAVGFGIDEAPGLLLAWPLTAVAGPLLVRKVDERARAFDPLGPQPREDLERNVLVRNVAIIVGLFIVIAAVAVPNLIETRKQGNESASIGALKTLGTAQSLFREADKDGDSTLDYAANLGELVGTNLIDQVLGGGAKQGYFFRVVHSHTTSEFLWSAAADPIAPRITGERYFVTNHEGVTYYTTTGPIPLHPSTCAIDSKAANHPVGR